MRILLALAGLLWAASASAQPIPSGGGSGGGSLTVQAAKSVTSYTIQASDCTTVIPFTASTTVYVTLPGNLPLSCLVGLSQSGAGAVVAYGGPGAVLAGLYNSPASQGSTLQFQVVTQPTTVTDIWQTAGGQGRYYSPSGTVIPTLPPLAQTPAYTFYVNSSTGNDSNPGTQTQPWATLTKVNNYTTFQPGTAIYFQGSWTGCLTFSTATNVSGSTTQTAGIQVASYGTGATITSNSTCAGTGSGSQGPKSAVIKFESINGVYASGMTLACANTGTQYGIVAQNSLVPAGINGITLSNNTITGCELYTSAPGATGDYASEIAVLSKTASQCYNVNNVLISGNTVGGTAINNYDDQGINVNGCYQNGVTNVTVINNNISDIGARSSNAYPGATGNGILLNGTQYSNVGFNTASYIGANSVTCGGPGGIWVYNSDNPWLHHNEVNHVQPTSSSPAPSGSCDWLAYDLDGCVTGGVISYNHSDNNYGNAWEFYQDSYPASGTCPNPTYGPNYIHHNISENDMTGNVTTNSSAAQQALGDLSIAGGTGNSPDTIYFWQNTIVNNNAANYGTCWAFYAPALAGQILDNICSMNGTNSYVAADGAGYQIPSSVVIDYNDYYFSNAGTNFYIYSYPGNYYSFASWQSGTGNDLHSIQTAPSFTGTPTYAPCTITPNVGPGTCPTALTLASGQGTGVALTANTYAYWYWGVTTDYYGAAVPSTTGSGFSMGAAQ